MKETLLSVGIDLGTTTTQMILSRLVVENTAGAFSVPRMEITGREILYESQIHFTPLLTPDTIDGEGVRQIIAAEYAQAGIQPGDIQTGAVIITGQTARKDNAREVLKALSGFAGEFVVATAGPALESVLAARGAGADKAAKEKGRWVLHMDIGGGTTNFALFDPEGQLADTGCINVGGRVDAAVELQVQALEEAAGLRPRTALLDRFITDKAVKLPDEPVLFSFSGGVADLIDREEPDPDRYHDQGVPLGRAIKASRLCQGAYLLGAQTIRATVVGAGTYATQLSGSTVYWRDIQFPIHDLPVMRFEGGPLGKGLELYDTIPALSLEGIQSPSFAQVEALADSIAQAVSVRDGAVVVVLEQDMAKALGFALQARLRRPILCIDGIHAPEGSYLDLGSPVSGAIPLVVKTLAFI